MAPQASLLYAKTATFSASECIACLDWAVANGAKVINLSFGFSSYSQALKEAFEATRDAGVICVAAAVNSPVNYDAPYADYPIQFKKSPWNTNGLDNIVAVTSTMENDTILSGGAGWGLHIIDFGAPGRRIPTTGSNTNYPYIYASGTSVATAITTAAIGLLQEKYPEESYRQTIGRLQATVDPAPTGNLLTNTITHGRINLLKAMQFQQVTLGVTVVEGSLYLSVQNLMDGRAYNLESSADLVNWSTENSFTASGNYWDYYPSPSANKKYYRVALVL